jgi:hypothetical protein
MTKRWQQVIHAIRLFAKGDGWWEIELSCGHKAAVLHGQRSPLGESCRCTYRCGEDVEEPVGAASIITEEREQTEPPG